MRRWDTLISITVVVGCHVEVRFEMLFEERGVNICIYKRDLEDGNELGEV